jgi:nitroimidazol reductase NimA-like FMN-containing flavoprotein (pyridoxamine 5'-phosphate oxidase superfamily)
MNRNDREIDGEAVNDLISRGRYAVIGLSNNDEPYIVTLSYGFDENRNCLYFHTAPKGLKLDILRNNPVCCATIIDDLGYCHGKCSHKYRSVVLFGKMVEVTELDEKKRGMTVMFDHLEEDTENMRRRFLENDKAYSNLKVLRMDIETSRGKESS